MSKKEKEILGHLERLRETFSKISRLRLRLKNRAYLRAHRKGHSRFLKREGISYTVSDDICKYLYDDEVMALREFTKTAFDLKERIKYFKTLLRREEKKTKVILSRPPESILFRKKLSSGLSNPQE